MRGCCKEIIACIVLWTTSDKPQDHSNGSFLTKGVGVLKKTTTP